MQTGKPVYCENVDGGLRKWRDWWEMSHWYSLSLMASRLTVANYSLLATGGELAETFMVKPHTTTRGLGVHGHGGRSCRCFAPRGSMLATLVALWQLASRCPPATVSLCVVRVLDMGAPMIVTTSGRGSCPWLPL